VLLVPLDQSEKHVELVEPAQYQDEGAESQESIVLAPVHLSHIQNITEKVNTGQLATDDFPNVKFVNVQVILITDLGLQVEQET
jgi:hypothetical protein